MWTLVLDPSLHSFGGHHFAASACLLDELRALGSAPRLLASRRSDDRTTGDLGGEAVFTHCVYGRSDFASAEFRRRVRETLGEMRRALRFSFRAPELVVLPSCDQVQLAALAQLMAGYRWFRKPKIVAWFLFPPDWGSGSPEESVRLIGEYREAFAAFHRSLPASDSVLFCETEELAATYAALAGRPVAVSPGANNAIRPLDPRPANVAPIFACAGHANRPKGYHLLPGALARVLARHDSVRFRIHGSFNEHDRNVDRGPLDALRRLDPRVEVSDAVLTREAYLAWLASADAILLPYDPATYEKRGSGLFAEAVALGIPTVVTKGSGFAEGSLRRGSAVAIRSHDESGLADAIFEAIDRLGDLREAAREFALSQPAAPWRPVLAELLAAHRGGRAHAVPGDRRLTGSGGGPA